MSDLELVDFKPTASQRKAKARFWLAAEDSLVPIESMPMEQICQLAGTSSVAKWWAVVGFPSWFLNKNTARQKLLANADAMVDRLLDIANETDIGPRGRATASSVVKAAELVLQYSGLQPPKKQEVQYRDQALAKMSPQQLQALILGKVKQLMGNMDATQLRELLGENVKKLQPEALDVEIQDPQDS